MHLGFIFPASPAVAGRLWLIAALFAGLFGLMPTHPVFAASPLVVTDLTDTDHGKCVPAHCTLRDAINMANTRGSPTTIRFGNSGTLTLNASLPTIDSDITIDGTGHAITVSGSFASWALFVNFGKTLHLQSIAIANLFIDFCPDGNFCAIIYNNYGTLSVTNSTFWHTGVGGYEGYGGPAILNLGTLSVISSTVSNNGFGYYPSISNGGTMTVTNSTFSENAAGGGIYNGNTLSVISSNFSNNYNYYASGGGIYNDDGRTLNVTNSTFSGNKAVHGGGIFNGEGTVTIINSTIVGNHGFPRYGGGGGLYNSGTLSVTNSTIANNIDGSDCVNVVGFGFATGTHNLIQDTTYACGLTNGVNGNLIGYDPKLGPLANHGGSTLTFLLLPGSPAINAGDNAACPAFDQRGVKRPQGGACDIGAVETLPWQRMLLPQVMR